jgi:hypothetical protein
MESHSSLSSSSSSSPPSSLSSESCCVKVAVNVRPLIGDEVTQGCRECVSVSPVTPQVSFPILNGVSFVSSPSFTFLLRWCLNAFVVVHAIPGSGSNLCSNSDTLI